MSQEKISSNVQQIAFSSGEIVPVSGLWFANHHACEPLLELWMRKGEDFPPCPACGSAANFTLLEEVPHISEDADFR